MRTRIVKWGNSLGLRIPKAFAEEVAVGDGSSVDLSISRGTLVVRPVDRRLTLDSLLEGVSEENLHAEVATGRPRGRESW
jgi:antitoxin MazE